jgi:hypothetical protein
MRRDAGMQQECRFASLWRDSQRAGIFFCRVTNINVSLRDDEKNTASNPIAATPRLRETTKNRHRHWCLLVLGRTWALVKENAADAEIFEATFGDWIAMAEERFEDLVTAGINPIKVLIDVDELLEWCRTNNEPNDSAARAKFVAQKMRRDSTGV